jgi:hypothetical protein
MSDDQELSHEARFLYNHKALIERGESAYGAPDSPAAKEALARVEARIALGRDLGTVPPPPPPIEDQVRADAFNRAHPFGDPRTRVPVSGPAMDAAFDRLSELPAADLNRLAEEVAKDVAETNSRASVSYALAARTEPGTKPSGTAIVSLMLADARVAVEALAEPADWSQMLNLIRGDRKLLELMAMRGASIRQFDADKARYRVK